jgi:hypothetical protein
MFVPREDSDASGGNSVTGYLYVSTDLPWPQEPASEGRLPDHWLTTTDAGDPIVVATTTDGADRRPASAGHYPIPVPGRTDPLPWPAAG